MARGPAGYGRYDDDPVHVGCPWARSDMTPCVARDGHLAITDPPRIVCVGCGNTLRYLLADLADDLPLARDLPETLGDPDSDADRFRRLVWEATKPREEEAGERHPDAGTSGPA